MTPGILIMGLNPEPIDAVGAVAMGYLDPRALRGGTAFFQCDNHLLLAEKAGRGTADLGQIGLLGQPLRQSICKHHLQSGRQYSPRAVEYVE